MLSLIAIALAVFALTVIALNGYVFVCGAILRRRSPSWIPLIGGVAGCLALVAGGWYGRKWCWIPIVLDWGSLPGIAHALAYHAIRRRRS
jgi:hypothetical protein